MPSKSCYLLVLLMQNVWALSFQHLDVVTSTPLDIYGKESLFSVAIEAKVSLRFVERYQNQEKSATLYIGPCNGKTIKNIKNNTLALLTSQCRYNVTNNSISNVLYLPWNELLESRRWSCTFEILLRWLHRGYQLTYSSNWIWRNTLSYEEELLSCGGFPNPAPRVMPNNILRSDQLELGKKYLNGKDINIVTIHRPPLIIITMNSNGTINKVEGFCYEMITALSKKFNFTFTLSLPYDGNWGSPMENGTFNGMVGMVNREWVDLALAGFTITQIRNTVIDFTHPFYEEPTSILIRAPVEQTSASAFLEPFSFQVWMIVLSSVLLVGPLLWCMTEKTGDWSPILYPHTNKKEGSVWKYIWETGFSLTAQSNKMRLNESSRVLLGMWWIYCIILIYTYTGTLIASLTVPRLARIFQNLEEMASQREILWTYRANTAHDKLFATNDSSSTYFKIGKMVREENLKVASDEEGIATVLNNNMAFIKEKSFLDFAMERDFIRTGKCRLTQVPKTFFSASFGLVLQTESVFLPLFNTEILRMMEDGLFTKWRKKYWPKPNKCSGFGGPSTKAGPRSLRIWDLSGHFLIFGLGVLISITNFVLERMVHRWKNSGTALNLVSWIPIINEINDANQEDKKK